MKPLIKTLLSSLLIVNCFLPIANCQNLVPNYSFEDTILCPDFWDQLSYAKGWSVNINSADYYHVCGSNGFSTPNAMNGYQLPATGDAYSGGYSYMEINPGTNEFIGRNLALPLTIGQKYYVSFKVSLAHLPWINCGIDKLGALFTNVFYGGDTIFYGNDTLYDVFLMIPTTPLVQNFAHIYSNQIITDTVNWTTVSGSFVADSAYKYILIGRFFDTTNTNFTCFNTNNKVIYYYVDDVCVSPDSAVCDIVEAINQPIFNNMVNLYPNPTTGRIFIETNAKKEAAIKIYNLLGKLVFQTTTINSRSIDLSRQPEGIYFISIHINETVKQQKIILIH